MMKTISISEQELPEWDVGGLALILICVTLHFGLYVKDNGIQAYLENY